MIRLRDLLLTAYAPLALRHVLVEGRAPYDMRHALATTHHAACIAPPRTSTRVVRLFAVQIR